MFPFSSGGQASQVKVLAWCCYPQGPRAILPCLSWLLLPAGVLCLGYLATLVYCPLHVASVPGVSAKSASAFLIGGWPYLNSFNLIMSTKTLHSNQGAFTGSGRNYHAGGHRSTHYTLVFLSLGRSSSLENHALSSGNVPDLFISF